MADTIKATLTPTTMEVAPSGAPVEAVVSIHNTGPTVEQYRLELEGLPDGWYSLPDTSTALFPNDRDEAKVTIRPPQGMQAAAGTYPFTLSVVSIANPAEKTSVTGTVQVVATATATLDAELRPSRVTGRKARYRILLRNGGNAPLDLDFAAHDSEEGCDFVFEPPTATLKAGMRATVTMRTRPLRTRLVGQEHPYDFQVLVKPSGGDPRPLQGQFIYKPRFRSGFKGIVLRFVTVDIVLVVLAFHDFFFSLGHAIGDGIGRAWPILSHILLYGTGFLVVVGLVSVAIRISSYYIRRQEQRKAKYHELVYLHEKEYVTNLHRMVRKRLSEG